MLCLISRWDIKAVDRIQEERVERLKRIIELLHAFLQYKVAILETK